MLPRHAISDADWDRIKDLMLRGAPGCTAASPRTIGSSSTPSCTSAVAPAIPWADLPERFGKPNTVWRRFDRWAEAGRWDPILVGKLRDPDLDLLILDSTAVRAHPRAAGAKKSGTAPAARPSRPSAAAAAASAPRSTGVSTGSGTPSSCS